jgi:hypothetical protein
MKKNTGFLLVGTLALVVSLNALHGCATKDDAAPAPSSNLDASTPPAATPAKFTIVGSGS